MATVNFKKCVCFSQSCSPELRSKNVAKYRLILPWLNFDLEFGSAFVVPGTKPSSKRNVILECFILVFS